MNLRFGELYQNGFYHIYNRGVDKRITFRGDYDIERFLMCTLLLNSEINIVSFQKILQGDSPLKEKDLTSKPLVKIIAIGLIGNHYHLVVQQIAQDGVSRFMHKLGTAYTKYFNVASIRTGALFQGKYKYTEIKDDKHLMRMIMYVNGNDLIHTKSRSPTSTFAVWTSHKNILNGQSTYVDTEYVLGLFGGVENYKNKFTDYIRFVTEQRKKDLVVDDGYLEK